MGDELQRRRIPCGLFSVPAWSRRSASFRNGRVISLHRNEWNNQGYWLGLPWQRQGLMMEAVIAVNDYWFDVLGFPVLRAPKAVANVASRRISEKTGMRVVANVERDYVSGRLAAEIWEITAGGMAREESGVVRVGLRWREAVGKRRTDGRTHRGSFVVWFATMHLLVSVQFLTRALDTSARACASSVSGRPTSPGKT